MTKEEAHGPEDGHDHGHGGPFGERSELIFSLACATLTATGWGLERFGVQANIPTALFIIAYILGAWFPVKEVFGALRERKFEIDALMLLAAAGAAILGEWFEGALLLALFTLGHALEGYAMRRARNAIEALSEIRVPSVVPLLVGGLRDKSEAISEAARTALMIVTRQDLGRLPDVWTVWWEQHRDEHRVEWLIQALTHDTASIRRAAGDELKMLTREYFGYYDDLPPRERERAQQRYADWWREDGQYRFR